MCLCVRVCVCLLSAGNLKYKFKLHMAHCAIGEYSANELKELVGEINMHRINADKNRKLYTLLNILFITNNSNSTIKK